MGYLVMSEQSKGVSTGVMEKFLTTMDKAAERDSKRDGEIIAAQQKTIRMLGVLLIAGLVILAMLVAGVVGVGVTGTIPGYGNIEIAP